MSKRPLVDGVRCASDERIVIFWGNWGRNPNLKHQPPTPGIGFRIRIHKHFTTFTVDERYTSSRCPCCESEVEHPIYRTIESRDQQHKRSKAVHHLLRCKNDTCSSRWWHRDVMSVANIRKQTMHILEHGDMHPAFKAKVKAPRSTKRGGKGCEKQAQDQQASYGPDSAVGTAVFSVKSENSSVWRI
jgi:hypothetical protein